MKNVIDKKLKLKDLEKEISQKSSEIGKLDDKNIIFNPNISCERAFIACERIANNVLKSDGTYLPELKNLLIFCFMVENTTNLPIKKDEDGNFDIDFIYSLMCSEIGQMLNNKFESDFIYKFLVNEVEQVLNYKKEVYFRKISLQNKTLKSLDNLIEEIKNAVQKVSSFADEHKNLISNGTLNKMIETINNAKVK